MRTSGVFTTHHYRHKIKSLDPFNIYYFSDVHKFARLHNEEKWERFLGIAEADKTALFVGGGDYTEIGSAKERRALATFLREAHEDAGPSLDQLFKEQARKFSKDIGFMKGRLVGLIGGNHDAQLQSGMYVSQIIADTLGTQWLGVASLGRISIDYQGKGTALTEALHHGKGAGTSGNAINKVIDLRQFFEADVYMMSDSHSATIDAKSRNYLTGPDKDGHYRIVVRDQVFIRTGSYLDGWREDVPSYVTDAALAPSRLGSVRLRVTPRMYHHRDGGIKRQCFTYELAGEFV